MVRARFLGAFAMTLLAATPGRGEPAAEPGVARYALSWVRGEGAETCPPARALSAEVERRLGRAVFDPSAERGFEVQVTRAGESYVSDVFVRAATGEALGHRTLRSDEPGCAPLLNATALAIALVIDPEAATRPPALAPSSAAFEPPPAPAPAPAPPFNAAPPATVAPALPPAVAPPPAPPAATRVALSLRGALKLGLVPASAPGLELAFGVRPTGRWGLSVEAAYVPPRNAELGAGSLDIGLTRAALLASFRLLQVERASWLLAAGPSLGAFHVAVRRPAPVTDSGDYWFSALQLQTTAQLLVTKGFFVEAGGSAYTPLLRQAFLVRPQPEAVWKQPPLAAAFFLGVGASIP